MDDLSFLGQPDSDNTAMLKIIDEQGCGSLITDRVSPCYLLQSCPLLYHAFEMGPQGCLEASIESPSREAVISLLRFCYTGSYLPPSVCVDDAPAALLLHSQVYKLAEDYNVPELKRIAHGNFSIQVELACSLPIPPKDLLETIRYVYANFASPQARQQQGLVHTLLNYCIFRYSRLRGRVEFLDVVRKTPQFHQDLCRTSMRRDFRDDCATDIIRFVPDTQQSPPGPRPTLLASRDLPEIMLLDPTPTPPHPVKVFSLRQQRQNLDRGPHDANKAARPHPVADQTNAERSSAGVIGKRTFSARSDGPTPSKRTKKHLSNRACFTESASEDDGFSIIHHPEQFTNLSLDDVTSPSEIRVSNIQNVLAAPGHSNITSNVIVTTGSNSSNTSDIPAATSSNHSEDDEWTML